MTNYLVGIDSGSTMCKSVLYNGETVVDAWTRKTGWDHRLSAQESLCALLARNNLSETDVRVSVTGYGREAIGFAGYTFTEIACHAFGGMYLAPGIQGVIDIGGQDSKVIHIRGGRVADFQMNDKCAAGTGRFLSMACDALGVKIEDIDSFADIDEAVHINSMCTVFAESKIIGLLAIRTERPKIMTGVLRSIADKIRQ